MVVVSTIRSVVVCGVRLFMCVNEALKRELDFEGQACHPKLH